MGDAKSITNQPDQITNPDIDIYNDKKSSHVFDKAKSMVEGANRESYVSQKS